MLRSIHMTHKTEANIFALGFTTIIGLGIISLFVAFVALLWLAFQVVMVMLAAIAASCAIIGNLYNGSEPLAKLLIICIAGIVVYKTARMVWR